MSSAIRVPLEDVMSSVRQVAGAYDLAGDGFAAYADGDVNDALAFTGKYAFADGRVWTHLDRKLTELRQSGAHSVSMLDVGCGHNTWTCRLVLRARELGLSRIVVHGVDLSSVQIGQARLRSQALAALRGVHVDYDVADLTTRLPESDASVDLTLCLYSVLSHIPAQQMSFVAEELARVTRRHLIASVRTVGSMPSGIVADIEDICRLSLDHRRHQYDIELAGGRRERFYLRLFSAAEFSRCFDHAFDTQVLQGLDFFHHRFAADGRWNPREFALPASLEGDLQALEELFAANLAYTDHANHILYIGRKPG